MIHPTFFHWILLLGCALVAFIAGNLNIIHGAAPDSRFYAIDRIVVWLLGVGLVIFSALIFLRQVWAIDELILCYALSIIEVLVTSRPETQALTKKIGLFKYLIFWILFMVIFFGIPMVLLIWLRTIFSGK